MSVERPKAESDFFAAEIQPPCASFEDTLVVHHHWHPEDAAAQVEYMLIYAQDLYQDFGGHRHDVQLPIVTYDEVLEKFEKDDVMYAGGFSEEIAGLTHRYLIGEGEDYPAFTSY
jgi:hypothetical protein